MGMHDKKYTDQTKNLFSILRVMLRTEKGTMFKVLLYLYSIHPGHATKTYMAKSGRFNPVSIGKHINMALELGYVRKTTRFRKFGDIPIFDDSYIITHKGITYVHDILDSSDLKL